MLTSSSNFSAAGWRHARRLRRPLGPWSPVIAVSLSPREEQQLRAIEAQLVADAPELDRVLRSRLSRRRKLGCLIGVVVGLLLMTFGLLVPFMITIGFLVFATAVIALIGPSLLGPVPPLNPRR
jgi:hypothetical protein